MSEKRAFLVLGPESSGCRLVTRLLISAGCAGDGGHIQRWDVQIPEEPLIVWRRSLPHAQIWPDVPGMCLALRNKGYLVQAVVTTRHWNAMIASQKAFPHVPTVETAEANLRRAYPYIFTGLQACGVPFIMTSYESLTTPYGVADLWRSLGLQGGEHEPVTDENVKWAGEAP